MIVGFDDVKSELICEGVVGDGCGGGRVFFIKDETLFAHDPITQQNIKLLDSVKDALKIFKRGCIITIECKDEIVNFDLSKLMRV